jgi:hypothetical protein
MKQYLPSLRANGITTTDAFKNWSDDDLKSIVGMKRGHILKAKKTLEKNVAATTVCDVRSL